MIKHISCVITQNSFVRSPLISTVYEEGLNIYAKIRLTGCKNAVLDLSILVMVCILTCFILVYKYIQN